MRAVLDVDVNVYAKLDVNDQVQEQKHLMDTNFTQFLHNFSKKIRRDSFKRQSKCDLRLFMAL